MFFRKGKDQSSEPPIIQPSDFSEFEQILKHHLQNSSDLVFKYFDDKQMALVYLKSKIDVNQLNQYIINTIQQTELKHTNIIKVMENLPLGEIKKSRNLKDVCNQIILGWGYLYFYKEKNGLLISIPQIKERSLSKSETEGSVFGSQVSFTEALETNLGLLREYIPNPMLSIEELKVGKVTQTRVAILHIQGLANEQILNTLKQRIQDLEFDGILDSSILTQLIEDNSYSIFPQTLMTERPDRVANALIEGKICAFVDGSPFTIIAPATFTNFFQTTEDHYIRWNMALFVRLLRITSMFISVIFAPAYVAILTYHYEVIPSALLISLGQTRSRVPFPPVIEALFLELTIELLREAGARLPTKVGQTIGIVGGIVIGQAAVQAGFTSNILIIIVALGALGSFTAPSYLMGTAIRIIRFPMIIIAGLWGAVGVVYGLIFLILHLLRLTSYGSPYLEPFYPIRLKDFLDSFIRIPYQFLSERPTFNRPEDKGRFNPKRAKEHNDLEEEW